MRILHLITDLAGGGAERQLSYLAPALAGRGHDVHVGHCRSGEFPRPMPGVELTRFRTRSNYDPLLLRQIGRLIDRVKPEIVQTWILQMDVIGGVAARRKRVPWLLREPSSAMAYESRSWKYWLRARIARSAKAIICNSRGGDEYWKDHAPATPRYVIPNGLPIAEIDAVAGGSLPAGVDDQAPLVLYVGRLSSDGSATKNLKELMYAMSLVRRELEATLVLCGEGPQKQELMILRQNLGLDRHVVLTGHLPPAAVWSLMKRAAVFVSLSAYEGFPNAVMEAMACRCPLVLSDIAAHRDIADETSALFVNPYDAQATANAIAESIRVLRSATQRAAAARERVEEWSTERMVDAFERVYEEVT